MDLSAIAVFITSTVRLHVNNERGASLVEYCLLIGLIALVCVGAATFLGGKLSGRLSAVGSSLS